MMLANIQEKFEHLTHTRKALFQHLDSLSSEALSFMAASDKWSIIEVVEHQVIVEMVYQHPYAGRLDIL